MLSPVQGAWSAQGLVLIFRLGLPPLPVYLILIAVRTTPAGPPRACRGGPAGWWRWPPRSRWPGLVGGMWLATAPLTAPGALIGLAFSAEAAQGATTLAFIVLWLLGGIFTPPGNPPEALAAISRALPSYGVVQVGDSRSGGTYERKVEAHPQLRARSLRLDPSWVEEGTDRLRSRQAFFVAAISSMGLGIVRPSPVS